MEGVHVTLPGWLLPVRKPEVGEGCVGHSCPDKVEVVLVGGSGRRKV